MPFSDDEQILIKRKSKLKTAILILGMGMFFLSLFTTGFCTNVGCKSSIEAFAFGWLALFYGQAAFAWLANPLLIIAWILLIKDKISAWIFGLFATIVSLSFLAFPNIIENETGKYSLILSIHSGYWLWLSSCLVTFFGSLILRTKNNRTFIQ